MGWYLGNISSISGSGVQSVTGLNTDNTDPQNPVIDISVASGITGAGTPISPLIASNRGLYSQTTDSTPVTATTIAGTLIGTGVGNLSVPENRFSVGDSFRGDFGGLMSAKNGEDLRILIRSNTVVLADSGFQNMGALTNAVWSLSLDFTIRQVGGTGVASVVTFSNFLFVKQSNGNAEGFGFNNINNTNFDTTISNTLEVTAQWSSTDPTNSIYSDIFVLQKIY
jgi:hypothetical protein